MPRQIIAPPFASNNLPADYLYFQRKYYQTSPLIYPSDPSLPKPLDTWYEKPLYGKVDMMGRHAYPREVFLKPIFKDLKTINFVSDAYIDMRQFVLNASAALKTCMTSIIDISTPVKAHESLVNMYYEYFMDKLDEAFMNKFLSEKKKKRICGFKRYMDYYLNFVDMNPNISFTLAAYLASNTVSNRISGMIIEFDKAKYDNDNVKWEKFLSSDFFKDYIRIAHQFGFFVNKHIPWQIAANPYSKGMRKYMKNYGFSDPPQAFRGCFLQAEYISYISFKRYLFASYNAFIEDRPKIEKVKTLNIVRDNFLISTYKTKRYIVDRKTEFDKRYGNTYDDFMKIYPEIYFLEKYIQIRLIENRIKISPAGFIFLIEKISEVLHKKGLYKTIVLLSDVLYDPRNKSKIKLLSKTISDNMKTLDTTTPAIEPSFTNNIY